MTHKMLLEFPAQVATEHLILRGDAARDGPLVYEASLRNRSHLQRYESGNVLAEIASQEDAEIAAREMQAGWMARKYFAADFYDPGGAAGQGPLQRVKRAQPAGG